MDVLNNTATKATAMGRDFTLKYLGLIPASDFLTRVNLVDSINYLKQIADGLADMPEYYRKAVGLDDATLDVIRRKVVLNENGNVKNIDSMTRNEQIKLQNTINAMLQKRIQHTTYGGTPHWMRKSVLGTIAGTLVKFPMEAFRNHGIFDMKGMLVHRDPRAMMNTFMWFAGGYISSMVRYEMQGRDYTEDDLIMAGLMQMPLVGAVYTGYKLGTDTSAVQSTMSNLAIGISDTVNSISGLDDD
jgi:hypothetical protein